MNKSVMSVLLLVLGMVSDAMADEQSAEQARFNCGVALNVTLFEKARAVERSNGEPVFQDLHYVNGEWYLGVGESYRGFAELFWEGGHWDAAEEMYRLAMDEYVVATYHFQQAFQEEDL